tara:strand:+ start:672 stop:842 length:171 start_codon:yes stop_codon:yes gene_type:complete
MLAELILIGKLLETVGQSTPKAVSPSKLFRRNGNTSGRISKPPTKIGPALGLEKYF